MYRVIAIVGCTASGKDTLARRIAKSMNGHLVCSYTTRPKRTCETDGVEHYFITKEEMQKIKDSGEMFAYTINEQTGYEYCASKDCLREDKLNIYIINPEGIKYLKSSAISSEVDLYAVMLHADVAVLERRALSRGDDANVFTKRLKSEWKEFSKFYVEKQYDRCIDASLSKEDVFYEFCKLYYEDKYYKKYDKRNFDAIFVDWDNTFCLEEVIDRPKWFEEAWEHAKVIRDTSWYKLPCFTMNAKLGLYLMECRDAGTHIFGLTHMVDSTDLPVKKAYCDAHLPGVISELFGSCTRRDKVDVMDRVCKVYGYKRENVLLIDDHPETLHDAAYAGYKVLNTVAL